MYAIPEPRLSDVYVELSEDNDSSFWDIEYGVATAKKNGTTELKLETIDNITKNVDVVIGRQLYNQNTLSYNARSISDIHVVNQPEELYVGQEYAIEAIGLSSDGPVWNAGLDPNNLTFESLTPNIASVKFGVVTALAAGTAQIKIKDILSDVNKIVTINVAEEEKWWTAIAVAETYSPTTIASSYAGFKTAFDYAKKNNYKKIVIPNGEYVISPESTPISVPSDICIDFNDAVIKMKNDNEFVKNKTAYTLFDVSSENNVILMNGHIYGENVWDWDETASKPFKYHNEHELLVHIRGECKGCKLINMDISYGPGFTVAIEHQRYGKTVGNTTNFTWSVFKLPTIEIGRLDDTGNPISGPNYSFRTNAFVKIQWADKQGACSFGNYQGYSLYHLYSRLLNVYWFDAEYKFLRKDTWARQYAFYYPPEGAEYMKISFEQPDRPTYADPDFGGFLHMAIFGRCYHTEVLNCTFRRSVSTGLLAWGDGTILDNCLVDECGYMDPASSIDWEDYGYMNHSVIVRNCVFRKGSSNVCAGTLTSHASSSLVFHDNIFDETTIDIRKETEFFRMYHNICKCTVKLSSKYDSVVAGNLFSSEPQIGTTNPNLQIFRADNEVIVDQEAELPFKKRRYNL